MATNFAQALFANQVRAQAGNAGLAGLAAGFVFNRLLRRSPVSAMTLGVAIVGYQVWRAAQDRKALRDASHALAATGAQPAAPAAAPPLAAPAAPAPEPLPVTP